VTSEREAAETLAMIARCAKRQNPDIVAEIVPSYVERVPVGFNREGTVPETPSIVAGYAPIPWSAPEGP
jgi:hypothetical protein